MNKFLMKYLIIKLIYLIINLNSIRSYLLILDEDINKANDVIFNTSVYRLGSEREYKINYKNTPEFIENLLRIDKKSGELILINQLDCNNLYYPNLFTIHIDSISNRYGDIDYYSLQLRIFIIGKNCLSNGYDKNEENYEYYLNNRRRKRSIDDNLNKLQSTLRDKLIKAKDWITETYASYKISRTNYWDKICLKKSQYINSIKSFLPKTIQNYCNLTINYINDERFKIELSQIDLVASRDVCIIEPVWKLIILFKLHCNTNNQLINIINNEHRLKLIYHYEKFNDIDDDELSKRVRRELRNQSPFFEKHLYIANVLEECEPGILVTTVKARDPENNSIIYQMTSLLDSRTQSMFELNELNGVIKTKVKLDRELVDVHYFRITAIDDQFPPHTGTTMLQINVIDMNDHSPVFELNEYDANVKESVSIGTTIITLKATDQDVGKNAEVEYFIESINDYNLTNSNDDNTRDNNDDNTNDDKQRVFKIDIKNGIITTRTLLDREQVDLYKLIIKANDLANPVSARLSSTSTVIIHVLDDNDNYPQFTERTYTITLNEDLDWTNNPVIATIKATDLDLGNNALIRYAIISGNTQSQFSIDSLTGDIQLIKQLDYEIIHSYRLVIRAQDGGSPSRSNTTQLLINIKDINDNSPRFYTTLFQESIQENSPIGYSIVKVQAYDADEGLNSEIKYTISSRDSNGASTLNDQFPLTIDTNTGWIQTIKELDREQQSKYIFNVIATDQGTPPQSSSASVIITVQDVNDNDPVFETKNYESVISEDDPVGTPVCTVQANDIDEDKRLHYELTNGNTRGRFSITSQNGRGLITIAQPLDYKQEKRFVLTVQATDSGGRSDTATIYINITDANNFAPVFENAPFTANVFEDAIIGTTVLVVSAIDNDVGINAQITYSINNNDNSNNEQFGINPETGAVFTTKLLDRESVDSYLLTVVAKDGGNPSLSDTTDVEIIVTDVNDNYPIFKQSSYVGNVLEDALIGTSILQISATDLDIGLNGRIHYTLSNKDQEDGTFVIEPISGIIRTNKGLDRESIAKYELEAVAIDHGSPTLSTSIIVTLIIDDINDSPPTFDSDKIVLYIKENSPIGSLVGEIYAKDPDEGINAIVQYSIIGGDDSQSFSLVTRPGSLKAELLTMIELDYESNKKSYNLIIRASSPPLRSDVHVEIIVTDINDNAPVLNDFSIIFNNYLDYFPTGSIGTIPAHDADITDKLTYKILSGNNANLILLNETTGELHLSPQLNTNVYKIASMEILVSDGINDMKAIMQLIVRLINDDILFNSITIRLNQMTKEAFLSPLYNYFIDALAAIIPCPKDNIFIFSIQDDYTDLKSKILNVSLSVKRPDLPKEEYYTSQFLQEKVYLNRGILTKLSTVQILPFDDNLCVREPCLNFEECLTILKFGNASEFISSNTILFRPIYPVTTFTCKCPKGFTGSREHYLCDTEVNLCYSSPCKNNGKCQMKEGGYTCVCPKSFTGNKCELELKDDSCNPNLCKTSSTCNQKNIIDNKFVCEECSLTTGLEYYTSICQLKSRSFSKGSFLTFPSLKQRHRLHIQLKFATQSRNGLLFYNGRYNEQHDFIALEIIENKLQFSFSLGDNTNISKVQVSIPGGVADGNWHKVIINYYNKTALLSIDNCDTLLSLKYGKELGDKWQCAAKIETKLEKRCKLPTEQCHRFLDLAGPFQLGGISQSTLNNNQLINKRNYFNGCISNLKIDYKLIDLNNYVNDNGTIAGCPEKIKFCSSNPCKNNGKCFDKWSKYYCKCLDGYGGKDCNELINKPWYFNGNGLLSFNPLLRPIQLPWLNSLSIRTLQKDTFLMSIQIGQNSTILISLVNGNLLYTYNDKKLLLNDFQLSDGRWHNINIIWLGTEIKLSIDYDNFLLVLPFLEKIQGLYIGKILIGGPDNTYFNSLLINNYYEGCIQDVRIGNEQTILNNPILKENVIEGCQNYDIENDSCQNQCPLHSKCIIDWGGIEKCECDHGYIGPLCIDICQLNPCENNSTCIQNLKNSKGYDCLCNSTNNDFSGEYCENKLMKPCPSSWWGNPICGPCNCNLNYGYNPDCNKLTGECYCNENYYQPKSSNKNGGNLEKCIPCDCYNIGSYNKQCNQLTGQCNCRDGVIGQKCNQCPNLYSEITLQGCQVIYDGCPRNFNNNIWWSRTKFDNLAIENCPKGSFGKASRKCLNELIGWLNSDLFNCTSEKFLELRQQLNNLNNKKLQLNTFITIKLSNDLFKASKLNFKEFYGADILIIYDLIKILLNYEFNLYGLNLTHSQDKNYIENIINTLNEILIEKYSNEWKKIDLLLNENSVENLIKLIENYLNLLSINQHDTYTNPFEIVTTNLVLGLDIVTPDSIYGYEVDASTGLPTDSTTEKIILPDTSDFLLTNPINTNYGPLIKLPKYNNYLLDENKFDQNTTIYIPLKLLGIKLYDNNRLIINNHNNNEIGAVISYVQYRQTGLLLPKNYDESIIRRWGIDLTLGSPLITISIHIPEYINAVDNKSSSTTITKNFKNIKFDHIELPKIDETKWILHPNQEKSLENESSDNKKLNKRNIYNFDDGSGDNNDLIRKKLFYKNLSGVILKYPIRLQIWLDPNLTIFNERSNPQCVHWTTVRGYGEWSRVGCRTEINDNWFDYSVENNQPILINCTCNHLSTFAVLVDVVDLEYIPEPSLLEEISSYSCFSISLPVLFITYLILALIRGSQTNSNTVRKNLILCVFLAELLYFIALKARKHTVVNEFGCKLIAIGLHYLWLASFFWMLVDAIHLYRMLTEMRDINHGPMRFYYSIGYVIPAVVVSLAVGVRAHQYGNYYFCWVSLYESVVWSLVGPICLLVFINIFILILSIRAAFTLQDHVLGFGNLRTLLWVSVVSLPLLGSTWILALLNGSERHPLLTPFLSASVLLHSIFSLIGYCIINNRVRHNLLHSMMKCLGKKVPLIDSTGGSIIGGIPSTSSQNINQSRSALAYHSGTGLDPITRRNIGISTSSTTSRSTTKTSSSPYRSDAHLRHTSTSTSNYNSQSDVPSYLRGYEQEFNRHRGDIPEENELQRHRNNEQSQSHQRHQQQRIAGGGGGGDSDSDSDGSEGRSLDLASSHSSDDDESSSRNHHHHRSNNNNNNSSHNNNNNSQRIRNNNNSSTRHQTGYLPNITEHVVTRCGTPPSLNIVTNSQLFPPVSSTTYGSRWSSQLPESYLPSNPNEIGRWSAETGSDNEFCTKTNSPNPLPNPDDTNQDGGTTCLQLPSTAMLQSDQYMVRTTHHYNNQPSQSQYKNNYLTKLLSPHHSINENMNNYHEYMERGGGNGGGSSDYDEKHHMNDKYLFPYTDNLSTAEEDHVTSPNNYPSSRMMSPVTINDINNPNGLIDYHSHHQLQQQQQHGSRIGSALGSIHGSLCGGSIRGSPSPLMPSVSMMHSGHPNELPSPSEEKKEETPV